jgi:outer membrane protein OmpA-like peptidoglycan-associated protein
MTLSTKTLALSAVIALGSLMPTSAQAGVLVTADGTPVVTKEGAAVLVNDGVEELEAVVAKVAEPKVRENAVYFDFNKSVLNKKAKVQLARLAADLRGHATTVAVVGFSDRMGNATYNERLALKRAKAVRDFLVAKGVKAKKIEVRSLGKSAPKADCADGMARPKMIACLAEDRRVEVEVR